MHDALVHVGRSYASAVAEPFLAHPLANYVRKNLRDALEVSLGADARTFLTKASAGAGNWSAVPWAAVFDRFVTDSATRGYYVVFLFSTDRDLVYLSLNQGATAVLEEFGSGGYRILHDRAELMRARLPEYTELFPVKKINLGSSLALPKGYEAGHALGKAYSLANLPHDDSLRADLQEIVRAYLSLTFRGGVDPTPESSSGTLDDGAKSSGSQTLIEIRRYRMHRRIERNDRASREAKKHHGVICQSCNFDFGKVYGELGRGYIEAHHLRPLGDLDEGIPVSYNVATDFAVLCANCHRMIHRTAEPANLLKFVEGVTASAESFGTPSPL